MRRPMTNSGTELCPIPLTCAQPDYGSHPILDIRDQTLHCLCQVSSSTETFNDRYCITTDDTTPTSVDDTTAKCGLFSCFSMGCNGGQPRQA